MIGHNSEGDVHGGGSVSRGEAACMQIAARSCACVPYMFTCRASSMVILMCSCERYFMKCQRVTLGKLGELGACTLS